MVIKAFFKTLRYLPMMLMAVDCCISFSLTNMIGTDGFPRLFLRVFFFFFFKRDLAVCPGCSFLLHPIQALELVMRSQAALWVKLGIRRNISFMKESL